MIIFTTNCLCQPSFAILMPVVRDGITLEPLEGCTLVIPETGTTAVTSTDGTARMIVPKQKNKTIGDFSAEWFEATILCYKSGYIDYALFNIQLVPGQTRFGPEILIFENDGSMETPFTVVESPPEEWTHELLDRYRP